MNTDAEWEKWGQKDPYFGVLTNEKYRGENLTSDAKAAFFQSGRAHVNHVLDVCRLHLDEEFSPHRVLDFGCGVGRLVIPFAEKAEEVVGLDISKSMLDEARVNCDEHQLDNVKLLSSDDELSALNGCFDLIHSVIVLQHIPVRRGRQIFKRLLGRLSPNGIGAIQVSYAKRAYADNYGQPGVARKAKSVLKGITNGVLQRTPAMKLLKQNKSATSLDPEMQMNSYDLNDLMFLIQSSGVRKTYVEFTDHGGELGAFLYFQMPSSNSTRNKNI